MTTTYKQAGVDIGAGDDFVDIIAPMAKKTYRKEVVGGVGPFAALFELDLQKYKKPIIVSSTDGVGTKLKLAIDLKKYDTIGQDLVAMCVNDLVCCGAEPLFFLDYFAMGKLKPLEHAPIIEGIANACKVCNCTLIGGETAEMPGMYQKEDFDLAGFAVGVVEKEKIISGNSIKSGDALIGISSSGIHSNGYSLVRKIIADANIDLKKHAGEILAPTKLYPPLIKRLLSTSSDIKGIAHITGGGLPGNVPRIIPAGLKADIDMNSWKRPKIFDLLQKAGHVPEEEMKDVFNLGIGLVLAVNKEKSTPLLAEIKSFGETAYMIGSIREDI